MIATLHGDDLSTIDFVEDYRQASDYEEAIDVLLGACEDHTLAEWRVLGQTAIKATPGRVGKVWRQRAAQHVGEKLDAYFRDRKPIRTEQAAMAYIKGMAQNLVEAGQALRRAADRLRKKQDEAGCNETLRAALQVERQAQELIGGQR